MNGQRRRPGSKPNAKRGPRPGGPSRGRSNPKPGGTPVVRPGVRPTTTPAVRRPPSYAPIAEMTAAIAPQVLHAVFSEHRPLVPAINAALEGRGGTRPRDRFWMARGLGALMRWWGWIEPLHMKRVEEQLLLAWLIDSVEVGPIAKVWAAKVGRHPDRLVPVGDAPNWTGRAEGLKRWAEERAVNADPWRLFPAWLRDQLPVPPGETTPKARKLDFLAALQTRPSLWVSVRGTNENNVWNELRAAELKPWIHRRILTAARLPAETDLTAFEAFRSGHLTQHDIASQAVALACDPDPGERWWDVNADHGLHSLHLAALMKNKGVVVATFENERRRKSVALKMRTSAYHNITTRVWDGRHVTGKAATYDGVLVDAISSGIGNWRKYPDARWTTFAGQIPELAAQQGHWLDIAGAAVKPGGTLVYTVATVTPSETTGAVGAFLASHPEFKLEPFGHPLEDSRSAGTIQLWPQIHDGEARFIARMTRAAKSKPEK
jgi:16S rRNA (cytosine967-C5)-methyltransferase